MFRPWIFVLATSLILGPCLVAQAQFGETATKPAAKPGAPAQPDIQPPRTQRWKVGIIISASRGPCAGIFGTVSVPTDWPEQDVKVVEEKFSDQVGRVRYRNLEHSVRQMLVTVPRLNPGEKAEAIVTFEVTRRAAALPANTAELQIPEDPPRKTRTSLGSSPMIETRSSLIRSKAKQITAGQTSGWETAQAIHDWVQKNIEFTNAPLQGALATLRAKQGNNEDLSNTFIALCRASKIPARIVWVPDYCYAEFYLEDKAGKGVWIPCELKEKTVFGTIGSDHIVLQKGDNIRVPEKKEIQRFVAEFVTGKTGRGLGRPGVRFVRQLLPAE